MFKIGDVVTRNSYGNDIVFEIIDMNGNNCVLKGIDVRLYADSNVEDLKIFLDKRDDNFFPVIDTVDKLDRNEYFYLPGKILHVDSDILLSNDLLNPYKIRKKTKIQKYINHQKKQKMSKI